MEFRFAQRKDTGIILDFINRLAEYEHMSDDVVATEALLEEWIFDRKKAQVLFALQEGKEVGIALYFYNFSTFLGRAGIYLEDLFVLPEYRGKGYGKGLLKKLGGNCRGRRMRETGMVLPELEPPEYRLLFGDGCCSNE